AGMIPASSREFARAAICVVADVTARDALLILPPRMRGCPCSYLTCESSYQWHFRRPSCHRSGPDATPDGRVVVAEGCNTATLNRTRIELEFSPGRASLSRRTTPSRAVGLPFGAMHYGALPIVIDGIGSISG